MTELKGEIVTTYTLKGLEFKDMELICLGLEDMDDCEIDMVDRKSEIVNIIDSLLNHNGEEESST